jgi:signal peptidase I
MNRGALYFHGTSMLPFLQEGDELFLELITLKDLFPGDIVVFREQDKFPVRRVLLVNAATHSVLVTSDHWNDFQYVHTGRIMGRVTARQREESVLQSSHPSWKWTARWRWMVGRLRFVSSKLKRNGSRSRIQDTSDGQIATPGNNH